MMHIDNEEEEEEMDEDDVNEEFIIEQRASERHREELRLNGYRDGYQALMNDESLMQHGFDAAFGIACRVGFLLGRIRAVAFHGNVRDAATLCDKMNRIEKQLLAELDKYIVWQKRRNEDKFEPSYNYLTSQLEETLIEPLDQFCLE